MKHNKIGTSELLSSSLIMGCMRLSQLQYKDAETLISTALDNGINTFDHADIYGKGECEEIFGKFLSQNKSSREKMIIQSKCGIRNGFYDFSKDHILNSVNGILKRLGTDYLDLHLLHRPDELMNPEETADALISLKNSGKVKYFGVSNQNPIQIQLLQKYLPFKLVANQMQMSIAHCPMITSNISCNMTTDENIDRNGNILTWCQLNDITLQAWSPFQKGFFEGTFIGDYETYPELNRKLEELGKKYNISAGAVSVAWLLRHPANIQVVLGTTNKERLKSYCKASDMILSREEWYSLYESTGYQIP